VVLGTVAAYRGRLVGAAVAAEDGLRVTPDESPLPFVPKLLTPQNRFDGASGFLCAGAVAAMEGVALHTLFSPFKLGGMSVAAWCGQALPRGYDPARQGAGLLLCLDTRPYTRDRPLGGPPAADGVPAACCLRHRCRRSGKNTVRAVAGGTQARWAGMDASDTRRCCTRRCWIFAARPPDEAVGADRPCRAAKVNECWSTHADCNWPDWDCHG
jgi:hypothetical protein